LDFSHEGRAIRYRWNCNHFLHVNTRIYRSVVDGHGTKQKVILNITL
jgi:hypothetical protein